MLERKLLLLTLLMLPASAIAHGDKVGDISIDHPWARALPPVAPNGAVYMELFNHGSVIDRLISGSSPIAERVELHRSSMKDGVVRMRPVKAINVLPGKPTAIAPGGLHIMLIGLKQPLIAGKTFRLTLTFERAGSVEVQVQVQEDSAGNMKH